MIPTIDVDLDRPPSLRWQGLTECLDSVRSLVAMYVRELGGLASFRDELETFRSSHVSDEHRAEMDAIADMAGVDPLEVFLANAYYDAFKHLMGCTAFAVDTPLGPVHARNLDWFSERHVLASGTIRVRYRRGDEIVFDSVSWPGFIGTLSGVAPGRFSVTLNAALSDDAPGIATPVSLQLRELLTHSDYRSAVESLRSSAISCDCLFLVCGIERGEMCVVERTPSRAAVRAPDAGRIVVTNDYRVLDAEGTADVREGSALRETSCGRFDRAGERLDASVPGPASDEDFYAILDDGRIKMDITVQQMVMSARRGSLSVRRGR